MTPLPRQQEFLNLECEEALYGGAAGGGKSEALLMWLAEGIHLPTYSGIIFRRTFAQLSKSNDSLIAKSQRLYRPLGGVWNATAKQWRFPAGAIIEMGALEHLDSIYNYQGPAFHRVTFDELTQFLEEQYLYLFSRLRAVVDFPLRLGVRASANPGGIGHNWVKQRFVPAAAEEDAKTLTYRDPTPAGTVYWPTQDRAFVPARLADNPHLQFEPYVKSLQHLSPVVRERLLNGDWSILENALVKVDWLRYYTMRGQVIELRDITGKVIAECDEREVSRFITIDPAGTSEDRSRESKGKAHSYSVAGVWDRFPSQFGSTLILRDVWRERVDFPDLQNAIRKLNLQWRPSELHIENEKLGVALVSLLQNEMPIRTIATGGKDKVTRAAAFLNMLSRGEVFLPQIVANWKSTYEAELLSWRGLDTDVADQVDMSSYAGIIAQSSQSMTITADFPFWNGTRAF